MAREAIERAAAADGQVREQLVAEPVERGVALERRDVAVAVEVGPLALGSRPPRARHEGVRQPRHPARERAVEAAVERDPHEALAAQLGVPGVRARGRRGQQRRERDACEPRARPARQAIRSMSSRNVSTPWPVAPLG